MQSPLRITFRNVHTSDAVESYVREHAAKLDRFCPCIIACHVAIEAPHRHKRHGHSFRVRIDLAIPGGELVVCRGGNAKKSCEDLYAAVDSAFDGARRVLDEHIGRRRDVARSPRWAA